MIITPACGTVRGTIADEKELMRANKFHSILGTIVDRKKFMSTVS